MPKGRVTLLTPALHTAIIQAVSVGVPYAQAAVLAGIDATTARQWRQRGEGRHPTRGQTPLYVAFVSDVKKAEAQDEARRIARINQAGQGGAILYEHTITHPDGRLEREVKHAAPQWQADAWHLERSRPDIWGRKDRVNVQVQIQLLAARVAAELGLSVEEVLAEAQSLLLDAG